MTVNSEIIDGRELNIHVKALPSKYVKDILLWKSVAYKSEDKISLNDLGLLVRQNNIEDVTISHTDLGIERFIGLYVFQVILDNLPTVQEKLDVTYEVVINAITEVNKVPHITPIKLSTYTPIKGVDTQIGISINTESSLSALTPTILTNIFEGGVPLTVISTDIPIKSDTEGASVFVGNNGTPLIDIPVVTDIPIKGGGSTGVDTFIVGNILPYYECLLNYIDNLPNCEDTCGDFILSEDYIKALTLFNTLILYINSQINLKDTTENLDFEVLVNITSYLDYFCDFCGDCSDYSSEDIKFKGTSIIVLNNKSIIV